MPRDCELVPTEKIKGSLHCSRRGEHGAAETPIERTDEIDEIMGVPTQSKTTCTLLKCFL